MLSGSRLILRAPQAGDLPLLTALRNDPALQARLLSLPRPHDAARVQDWLSRRLGDPQGLFFVIAERADDRALGFVQLTHIEAIHGTAELGICLAPAAQGQGHGGEAIGLLEAYAQSVFGLRKIGLKVLADNASAVSLYRRLGYREVGVLREHFYHADRHHDVLIMEHMLP